MNSYMNNSSNIHIDTGLSRVGSGFPCRSDPDFSRGLDPDSGYPEPGSAHQHAWLDPGNREVMDELEISVHSGTRYS